MTDKLPTIRALRVLAGQRLAITWGDGQEAIIDLAEMVAKGGIFAALQDPEVFARARIGDRHRTVEWIDPRQPDTLIDVDADTLKLMDGSQGFIARLFRARQPHGA